MMDGVVKNLIKDRNFGFIRSGNKDYFFHRDDFSGHWDDMIADIAIGRKVAVEFEAEQSNKGPRASKVRRIE